jgi:hypothetical protein
LNKQRKAKLHARALAYSNANQERGADSFSFEDGYRAAMRDMRKELQATERNCDTGLPMAIRRGLLLGAIRNFLLPLR